MGNCLYLTMLVCSLHYKPLIWNSWTVKIWNNLKFANMSSIQSNPSFWIFVKTHNFGDTSLGPSEYKICLLKTNILYRNYRFKTFKYMLVVQSVDFRFCVGFEYAYLTEVKRRVNVDVVKHIQDEFTWNLFVGEWKMHQSLLCCNTLSNFRNSAYSNMKGNIHTKSTPKCAPITPLEHNTICKK